MESKNKSVLIIEDHEDLANSYDFFFKKAGYDVAITDTKRGAIENLRYRTFTAALVDLQLRDDVTHKGGLEVLEYMKQANEGIPSFVVSGTPEVRDAVRAYETGIIKFIPKGVTKAKEIIEIVESTVADQKRPLYGGYTSLAHYLSAPEMTPIWQSQLINLLQCNYELLNKLFWSSLKNFLPLLRLRDASPAFKIDKDKHALNGLLWSKGKGYPIWFSACSRDGQLIIPSVDMEPTLVLEKKYRKTMASVWRLAGINRNDFIEFIWDTPWEKKGKA